MGRSIRMITRQQEDTARPERMPAQAAAKTPGSNPKRQPSIIPYYSELEVLPHDAKPVTAQMTFAIDIDIANLIVQAFIGLVTLGALIAAFWQINQNKRNREYDIKRHQSSRISAWYDEGKNQIDRPKDSRFVWQLVVLRNESESPVYDVIVTCVGINGAGPSSKGRTTAPFSPTAPASARFLLEHGAYGSRPEDQEWECERHLKWLSSMQTGFHGFGEAMEGSRRSPLNQPCSTDCPSP